MTQPRWSTVDAYITERLISRDPSLDAALEASVAERLPPIQVTPGMGKLLMLLAQSIGARTILEIGTLGGYSTIWLARALPADGRLVTLELDPRHAEVARGNLERAGVADRVEIRVGPALDTLEALAAERAGPFDFCFIDADKQNNPGYFRRSLSLCRQGSLIVVDNVVRGGAVAEPSEDPAIEGTRRLYEALAAEPRVSATALQTVGDKGYDGFALVRVLEAP